MVLALVRKEREDDDLAREDAVLVLLEALDLLHLPAQVSQEPIRVVRGQRCGQDHKAHLRERLVPVCHNRRDCRRCEAPCAAQTLSQQNRGGGRSRNLWCR